MSSGLERTIAENATQHRVQADKVFAGLERSIQDSLSGTGEAVQKQVGMIDKTMGEEVEKVMRSMAGALTSISGQFTADYKKLTGQMAEIVRTRA
jgi:asparagine synthetase A